MVKLNNYFLKEELKMNKQQKIVNRRIEVHKCLIEHMDVEDIAKRLNVSVSTIRNDIRYMKENIGWMNE